MSWGNRPWQGPQQGVEESESGLGADLLSQLVCVRADPVVSCGANSLRVNFIREKILGECFFAFRISECPLQGRICKGNKDCWKKQGKRSPLKPYHVSWEEGIKVWPLSLNLWQLWRTILAQAPLRTEWESCYNCITFQLLPLPCPVAFTPS